MTIAIKRAVRSLTVAERAGLAEETIPDWQIKELEHRRRLYDADPQRAIPWAQAKAQILKRHAQRRRPA